MAKPKTIKMGPYTWEGRTVREARAQRDKHLEGLLWDVSSPSYIRGPAGVLVAVYREALGWSYDIIRPDMTSPGGTARASSVTGYDSRHDATIAAGRHLAQMAYGEPDEENRGEDSDGMRYLDTRDDEGRKEHARWVAWQRTYAKMTAPISDGGMGLEIHEAERRLMAGERF